MVLSITFNPPSNTLSLQNTNSTHHLRLLQILQQCTSMSRLKQVHAQTLRTSSTHHPNTPFLLSRILHFSSLHDLNYTFRIFHQIENPNSFMWNTLIRACASKNGFKEQAILLYIEMVKEGNVFPDKHTFPFVLKACSYLFAESEGKQIHTHVVKSGFDSDVYVNNSLIHFYGSCGCLKSAKKVFDKMSERSVVSWNSIIDALVQLGEFEMGLKLFVDMQKLFEPDGYLIQSVLSACANLGASSLGMWVHLYILRKCDSNVSNDVLVNNSLVEMYCKCGLLDMARQVFERMPKRDVTSWNSMILGFAMHGQVGGALEYFERMVDIEGFVPNSITFVGVLSAYNHRGMVSEGRMFFDLMITKYKIEPVLEHYGCLVDLLARAGLVDEALDLVSKMPMKPDLVIWRSLLDACCKKNLGVKLSEEMAKHIIDSGDGDSSGVYVLLSRVYASARLWNEVGLIRKLMTDRGVKKEPGGSSIEIDGVSHEFFAGDTSHPRRKEIFGALDMIEERVRSMGYEPDLSQASMVDDFDFGKRDSLKLHSERLAIAFGLLNMKPGTPIRVLKNLRVCNDCHNVTKLISRIYDVEIIVRDRARFHHFRDGSCSCMDYW